MYFSQIYHYFLCISVWNVKISLQMTKFPGNELPKLPTFFVLYLCHVSIFVLPVFAKIHLLWQVERTEPRHGKLVVFMWHCSPNNVVMKWSIDMCWRLWVYAVLSVFFTLVLVWTLCRWWMTTSFVFWDVVKKSVLIKEDFVFTF